ncbi:MAG TPA: Crp/Fnr family transcriptional regulator [Thermoanaerobaculia bacterium]|nr:Crp/Fnr family transcriptional regulator [Thermoanaerobaculia bacterium]
MSRSVAGPVSLGDSVSALIRRGVLRASTLKLAKHATIYSSGDPGTSMYVVEEGWVKIVTHSRAGKDCLLAIRTNGDLFGEQALLGEVREETATAMSPTTLKRVSRDSFIGSVAQEELLEALLRYSLTRLSEQQDIITDFVTADSEQRLASTLLRLGRKLGRRAPSQIRIEERISQEDLSRIVGTTRSRVGFFLKRFEALGLIETSKNCFLAINEQRLCEFVEREA